MTAKSSTVVSTKGQVILPKALRDQNNWGPGTRLVVEQTDEGLLLRKAPHFKPTRIEDVVGMVRYTGPTVTIEQMDQAVLDGAAEDWARFEQQSREDRDCD